VLWDLQAIRFPFILLFQVQPRDKEEEKEEEDEMSGASVLLLCFCFLCIQRITFYLHSLLLPFYSFVSSLEHNLLYIGLELLRWAIWTFESV
jgi:hypothetical protein